MAGDRLSGSFWILFLYDICEEIRLETLRALLRVEPRREPSFRHPSPEYVRFERPPVVQRLEPIVLESGSRLQGELNYYEYGVVSIKLELPFEVDWPQLVDLSSRWIDAPELEARAVRTVRDCLKGAQAALVNPHEPWLNEDYYIIHLKNTGAAAAELIDRHGKNRQDRTRRAGGAIAGRNQRDSGFTNVLLSGGSAGSGLDGGFYS